MRTPSTEVPPLRKVKFREYAGGWVPMGAGGPSAIGPGTAAGWKHSRTGAAFAAAHMAIAADPAQPRRTWKPVLATGVPRDKTSARVQRFADRHQKIEKQRRSDPGMDQGPAAVWRPNMRVVGFDRLRVGKANASVRVWGRTDGSPVWRSRHVRLRWRDGDWRLVVSPLPDKWDEARPPRSMTSYSELGATS